MVRSDIWANVYAHDVQTSISNALGKRLPPVEIRSIIGGGGQGFIRMIKRDGLTLRCAENCI